MCEKAVHLIEDMCNYNKENFLPLRNRYAEIFVN